MNNPSFPFLVNHFLNFEMTFYKIKTIIILYLQKVLNYRSLIENFIYQVLPVSYTNLAHIYNRESLNS